MRPGPAEGPRERHGDRGPWGDGEGDGADGRRRGGGWRHHQHHRFHGRRHRHGHGPLFWRVYLHGVALLVLVAVAVAVTGWLFRPGSVWNGGGPAVEYATSRVEELRHDPPRLAAELTRVREAFGVSATVWDGDGSLVASSAEPPIPRDRAGEGPLRAPGRLRGRPWGWAVPLKDGAILLAAPPPPAEDHLFRLLSIIGAVLVALAVGSVPLARSIAAPLERITDAARRLGEGDLSARANVRGRGEVGELGRTFDEAAARLERLVRSEQELLANVSHELRTPMARIRVALELAAEGDLEKARRHLAGIGADLDELDRLVEDVLAAARLDMANLEAASGQGSRWPIQRAPVDLEAVAREAVGRWGEAHPDRVADLIITPSQSPSGLSQSLPVPGTSQSLSGASESRGAAVQGDAALLRRLVANLVDNAGKYSEAPAPITVRVRVEGGVAVLEVQDRGIGIDAADLPRLFTPFFRTDRSRQRGTGGTGLGLALVKRIADAHGGEVSVASEVGKGTTVTVRLPG
ncbi:MAG: HAMP domain-containing sensor histidine kinase [Anaeromyxobacter sp.]